jgi:hypothetical protein
MCSCEIDQTPPRRQKKQSKIKAAQRRSFTVPPTSKACITSPTQLDFLESCSEHFGYGLEFIASFDLYFCSTCNSRYQQAKHKAIIPYRRSCIRSEPMASSLSQTSSQPPSQTSQTSQTSQASQAFHDHNFSEFDENYSFQSEQPHEVQFDDFVQKESPFMSVVDEPVSFNLQLLVKKVDGASLPIKWIQLSASDFSSFEDAIEENVQQLPNLNCKGTKCFLSYKTANARMLTISLADDNDFKKFVEEYKKLTDKNKNMSIICNLHKKNEKSGRNKRKTEV